MSVTKPSDESRHSLSPGELARLVAAEADPFSFDFAEYRRLVDRLVPGTPDHVRREAFELLPSELQRLATALLRSQAEADR